MSYKIRNTIVLSIVWLVITAGLGLYWKVIGPKSLQATQKAIKKIDIDLVNLPAVMEEVAAKTREFMDVKRRYDSRSKLIPVSDASAETYAYLNQGQELAPGLRFNMQFKGSHFNGTWGYNSYSLENGEGSFGDLYRFIYFLENGSRLYKITDLYIQQLEKPDEQTHETVVYLGFSMVVNAYFTSVTELGSSLAAKTVTQTEVPPDPFNPVILSLVPTVAPDDQVDADKVEVKAVVPGKAFVVYEGELLVFRVGDKVWKGTVSRIAPAEGLVEFVLNDGGVVKHVEKRIKFVKKRRW